MTIGIDEVGRGPLAGPVTVAAILLPRKLQAPKSKLQIRDSKKLNPKQRLLWYQWLKEHPEIKFAVASCQPKTIDKINIAKAANNAAYRVYKNLLSKVKGQRLNVILDGGLKLPQHIPHKTIIKGDEKYKAIMLASIVAKVRRDKYMEKKHRLYPQYGFALHKGYGTKVHRQAIKKHGPCPIHRLSFLTGLGFRI